MSTVLQIPKQRVGNDVNVSVRLTDSGVKINWNTVEDLRVKFYSDKQGILAGDCRFVPDPKDGTLLKVTYPAAEPQYLGINKLVLACSLKGMHKTYDKPVIVFVDSSDAEGVAEVMVPVVELESGDISSDLICAILNDCLTATEASKAQVETATTQMADIIGRSERAVESSETATADAVKATLEAQTARDEARSQAGYAQEQGGFAEQATADAQRATTKATSAADLATTKAGEAEREAGNAHAQAGYAQQQGDYAQEQGGHAGQATKEANAAATAASTNAELAKSATTEANAVIDAMRDMIAQGYIYKGIATPGQTIVCPADQNAFWFANQVGDYIGGGEPDATMTMAEYGMAIIKHNLEDDSWDISSNINEISKEYGGSHSKTISQQSLSEKLIPLNGAEYKSSVKAKLGEAYDNIIESYVPRNVSFELTITGESGILTHDLLGGCELFFDDGTSQKTKATNPSCVSYKEDFLFPSKDLIKIVAHRDKGAVLQEKEIRLLVKTKGKRIIDAVNENTANINDVKKITSPLPSIIGNPEEIKYESIVPAGGEFLSNELISIKAGREFTINVTSEDGVIQGNTIGSWKINFSNGTFYQGHSEKIPFTSEKLSFEKDVESLYFNRGANPDSKGGIVYFNIYVESSIPNKFDDLEMKISSYDADIKELQDYDGVVKSKIGDGISYNYETNVLPQGEFSFSNFLTIPANKEFSLNINSKPNVIQGNLLGGCYFEFKDGSREYLKGVTLPYSKKLKYSKETHRLVLNRGANPNSLGGVVYTDVEIASTTPNELDNIKDKVRRNENLIEEANTKIDNLPIGKTMYIAPNGEDNNDGLSPDKPKLTISSCIDNMATTIIVKDGEYYEDSINLRNAKTENLNIITNRGRSIFRPKNNVLIGDGREELVPSTTKVYKHSLQEPPTNRYAVNGWLFFDNLDDKNTEITIEEKHPCQRGKFFRCGVTKIMPSKATDKASAIQEIESSNICLYWYEPVEKVLYFGMPSGATTLKNPIHKSSNTYFFTRQAENQKLALYMKGIEFRYMCMYFYELAKVKVVDCSSIGAYGAGGAWCWYNQTDIEFVRCEAALCNSDNTGDGFNGHADKNTDVWSRDCTCSLIDCWSHDNNDDGYSDHERAEINIHGGLYEYNGKAGITPSTGSNCTGIGILSRKNHNGYDYVNPSSDGRNGGCCQFINCIAENNKGPLEADYAGFILFENNANMILYNCISIGSPVGYSSRSSNGKLICTDCKVLNCTKDKLGNVTIVNTNSLK